MKPKATNESNLWLPRRNPPVRRLAPARQRLHQNVKRLQFLDKQLYCDHMKRAELLTTIELVAFKVRHLAQQIQEAEHLDEYGAEAGPKSASSSNCD